MPTRSLLLVIIALLLAGCPFLRSAEVPMPVVSHGSHGPASAEGLVVFLPGFGDGPDHFVDNGFVARVQKLSSKWDVTATDAHFGYYRAFSVIDRLRHDVILPAKQKGYKKIWLVGISMGGFGALSYAQRYPEDIEGVVAIAAYMGEEEVVEEVVEAGGLKLWTPPKDLSGMDDRRLQHTYRMWTWFKSFQDPVAGRPSVFLAWGADDRLGGPNGEVAELLPPSRVFIGSGGHKWTAWRPLFARVVAVAFDNLRELRQGPQAASSTFVSPNTK